MEKYDSNGIVSKLFNVFEGLINAKNLEAIINVIEGSGSDTIYLRSHLHDYLIKYRREDYDKYMALIKSKIRMYSDNKKIQKKEKDKIERESAKKRYVAETLPNASKLIKMFITSSYSTLEEFINNAEINVKTQLSLTEIYNKSLELVKEYDKELYSEYLEKLAREEKKFYNNHVNEILTMISLLKTGIEENGTKRTFDLIDCFQLTDLSFADILKITKRLLEDKKINAKEYGLISKFISLNKNGREESSKDIANIYNEERIINVIRKSEAGVSNTLETIGSDTIDKLISYLRNNNIPVNFSTYIAALNRYKFGYILVDNNKAY